MSHGGKQTGQDESCPSTENTNLEKHMYYAVVTFGTSPKQTVFSSIERAKSAAQRAVGRGSCTTARVYECETRKLAKTADISKVRKGERIV